MAGSHRIESTAQDAGIFARFLDGDDGAFVQLFDRYDRGLRLYSLKIVGSQQVAEDLTQELWERVIRMRSESRVIAEPARYLMRMARNLCLKFIRDRRLAASLDDISEAEHPSVSMPEKSHMEELVVMALAKLPFDQRDILVLHNYCGYSYEDIAQLRGDTLGSVKMRALRGRSRIGRIISAYLALDKESEGSTQPDSDSEIYLGEQKR